MIRTAGIILRALPVAITCSDTLFSFAVVNGDSMQPTLNPSGDGFCNRDIVLLDKTSKPNKGDVVVLLSPESSERLIVKRLIGTHGDWIKSRSSGGLVHVPKGKIWVEGDNSQTSRDSEQLGAIPSSLIQAKASHIVWPPSRWSRLAKDRTFADRLFIISQQSGSDFPRRSRDDDWW